MIIIIYIYEKQLCMFFLVNQQSPIWLFLENQIAFIL